MIERVTLKFGIHWILWGVPGSGTDESMTCNNHHMTISWLLTSAQPDLEALLLTMEVATGNLLCTLSSPTPKPTAGGPKKCWNTAPVWCRAAHARIKPPKLRG